MSKKIKILFYLFVLYSLSGCYLSETISSYLFIDFEDTSKLRIVATSDTDLYIHDYDLASILSSNPVIIKIEKLDLTTKVRSTVLGGGLAGTNDGIGPAAEFTSISQMQFVSGTPDKLYIADRCAIRVADLGTMSVTTIVGDVVTCADTVGTGTSARLQAVVDFEVIGDQMYVVTASRHSVKRIDLTTNILSEYAGASLAQNYVDGALSTAKFKYPNKLVAVGTDLFISDNYGAIFRKIDTGAGTPQVSTVAGHSTTKGYTDDADGLNARFQKSSELTTDGSRYIFLIGTKNRVVRKIDISNNYATTTITGSSTDPRDNFNTVADSSFLYPQGVIYNKTGLYIYSSKSIVKIH